MTLPVSLRSAPRAAATAAVGAVTGLCSVAVHDTRWGLPLLTLASLAGLLALPARWSARPPFALAWSLVVVLAVRGRPEGDAPVDADGAGWLLVLLAGVLPMLAILTTSWRGRRGPIRGGRGAAT